MFQQIDFYYQRCGRDRKVIISLTSVLSLQTAYTPNKSVYFTFTDKSRKKENKSLLYNCCTKVVSLGINSQQWQQ